jgi:hypothetical protein
MIRKGDVLGVTVEELWVIYIMLIENGACCSGPRSARHHQLVSLRPPSQRWTGTAEHTAEGCWRVR